LSDKLQLSSRWETGIVREMAWNNNDGQPRPALAAFLCSWNCESINMTKSNHSNRLDAIADFLWLELRTLNYRKSKRLFNRIQPDGIVHVIDLHMGQSWSTLQGKFTVEVGIFIPEVYRAFWEKPTPKFITSPDCDERKRLGVLGKSGQDIWWDLTGDERTIGSEVLDLLLKYGEQYFSQFSSREKLLAQWEQERFQKNLSERKKLIMAIMLAHCGEKKRANELLEIEFGGQYKTAFLEYAQNVIIRLGMDFPALRS
jgi:Domain of unknown function (DUF4304)